MLIVLLNTVFPFHTHKFIMITVFSSEKENNQKQKTPLFWDFSVDYGKSHRLSILIPFIIETRIQQYTSLRRPSIMQYTENANLVLNDLKIYLPMNKYHDYCSLSCAKTVGKHVGKL